MKISFKKDPNKEFIYDIAGKRHNIERFKIIVDGIDDVDEFSEKKFPTDHGEYIIKTYSNGLVSYGFMAAEEKDRPGHGGLWSSSCGDIYENTGIELIDVLYHNRCYALPVKEVFSLLPDGYFMMKMGKFSQFESMKNSYCVFKSEDKHYFGL